MKTYSETIETLTEDLAASNQIALNLRDELAKIKEAKEELDEITDGQLLHIEKIELDLEGYLDLESLCKTAHTKKDNIIDYLEQRIIELLKERD